jgi:hypothetical protein
MTDKPKWAVVLLALLFLSPPGWAKKKIHAGPVHTGSISFAQTAPFFEGTVEETSWTGQKSQKAVYSAQMTVNYRLADGYEFSRTFRVINRGSDEFFSPTAYSTDFVPFYYVLEKDKNGREVTYSVDTSGRELGTGKAAAQYTGR